MRRFVTGSLMSMAMFAVNACAQMPPMKPDASIDDVLDALHASGQTVQSFSADIKRQEFDDVAGTEVDRTGKVWFLNQANRNVTFHVYFDHKISGKHVGNEKVEYLIKDGWLTVLDYTTRHGNHQQLNAPGQAVNLFQLGQGQFPLPIGQDKKSVHDLFDVVKADPEKEDPANTVHLKFIPKPNTQFAAGFSVIEVWMDLTTKMPVRIASTNARKSEDTVNDLLNMKINPKLAGDELSVPPQEKSWNYTETPLPP